MTRRGASGVFRIKPFYVFVLSNIFLRDWVKQRLLQRLLFRR